MCGLAGQSTRLGSLPQFLFQWGDFRHFWGGISTKITVTNVGYVVQASMGRYQLARIGHGIYIGVNVYSIWQNDTKTRADSHSESWNMSGGSMLHKSLVKSLVVRSYKVWEVPGFLKSHPSLAGNCPILMSTHAKCQCKVNVSTYCRCYAVRSYDNIFYRTFKLAHEEFSSSAGCMSWYFLSQFLHFLHPFRCVTFYWVKLMFGLC